MKYILLIFSLILATYSYGQCSQVINIDTCINCEYFYKEVDTIRMSLDVLIGDMNSSDNKALSFKRKWDKYKQYPDAVEAMYWWGRKRAFEEILDAYGKEKYTHVGWTPEK